MASILTFTCSTVKYASMRSSFMVSSLSWKRSVFISRTSVRLLTSSDDVRVVKSMVAALNLCTAARCWSVRPQPTWRTEKQAMKMSRAQSPRVR
jgi:hypothetical protein